MNKEHGIVHKGDWNRLTRCMRKAQKGEDITVAFLGGSITQGSLSSTPETCYAYLVYKWWVEHFPNAKMTYLNAGIGGTTSQFGVARVQEDVLDKKPDFLIVEFSVNDDNTQHFKETYEGLVRKVLQDEKDIALMLLHNVCYDTGISAEEVHSEIGRHYNLPCVSIKNTVYEAILAGEFTNRDVTPDDLHPNDAGHALVAEAVKYFLDKVYESVCTEAMKADDVQVASTSACEVEARGTLPSPITANEYENSIRYQNHNSTPVLEGFVADDTPMEHITQMFRRGFTAWKKGDRITFSMEGTGIAIQYRKTIHKPTPIAKVVIDGQETESVVLDGNFQETWGDCLYIETVAEHIENKNHKVEIIIIEDHADDQVPFYLVSVIGSN